MKYGFCTGFATDPLFSVDSSLEAAVYSWGFDFIEYPLMTIVSLDESEFSSLMERRNRYHLESHCVCNFFPDSVPVIGPKRDETQIRNYLADAFERAKSLGVKKIIFGSAGARKLGDYKFREASEEFLQCLVMLDLFCEKYGMKVLIEAIRKGEADFINTLDEAAAYVTEAKKRGCRNVALMADLFHMFSNRESLNSLEQHLPMIEHIHVCEADRRLPDECFSDYFLEAFHILNRTGYSGSVSYESVCPDNIEQGIFCCSLLRRSVQNEN